MQNGEGCRECMTPHCGFLPYEGKPYPVTRTFSDTHIHCIIVATHTCAVIFRETSSWSILIRNKEVTQFSWFSSIPPGKWRYGTSIRTQQFPFDYPFNIHKLSHHPMLCGLCTDSPSNKYAQNKTELSVFIYSCFVM